ncbi:hypothetical protein HPG69_005482, partial [Diceros bicornis minor]
KPVTFQCTRMEWNNEALGHQRRRLVSRNISSLWGSSGWGEMIKVGGRQFFQNSDLEVAPEGVDICSSMGTFIGHVYPGLFLVFYGLYQAIVVSKAAILNDSLLYPSCPPRNKGRWARLWKISCGAYVISCIPRGLKLMNREIPPKFMHTKDWQHLTMFVLFTLNGCVDVTSKNLLPQRCVVLEK